MSTQELREKIRAELSAHTIDLHRPFSITFTLENLMVLSGNRTLKDSNSHPF